MVRGNDPIPYEQTVQDNPDPARWNLGYMALARAYPVFLATDPLYCNVVDPPILTDEMLHVVFGREPGMQNPPCITETEALRLLHLVGVDPPAADADDAGAAA